ncbi:TspO/MBR-related protein, partial [Neoconidiobolus thromboides FSU 785]
AVPLVVGFASAWDTREAVRSAWYQKVKKPSFNPPRYVFAPIWTYLYISTGYALYLVCNATNLSPELTTISSWGIYAFWTQFLANLLWSKLYFVQREINLALADITLLWGLSIATCISFFMVNPLAGGLMLPYIVWATYALALTYAVKQLNP